MRGTSSLINTQWVEECIVSAGERKSALFNHVGCLLFKEVFVIKELDEFRGSAQFSEFSFLRNEAPGCFLCSLYVRHTSLLHRPKIVL